MPSFALARCTLIKKIDTNSSSLFKCVFKPYQIPKQGPPHTSHLKMTYTFDNLSA